MKLRHTHLHEQSAHLRKSALLIKAGEFPNDDDDREKRYEPRHRTKPLGIRRDVGGRNQQFSPSASTRAPRGAYIR